MMARLINDRHVLADMIAVAARQRRAPLLSAIDGRCGAGKSTLALALSALPGAFVIEGDDFCAGGTSVGDHSLAARAAVCIDWTRRRPVLEALRRGQAAQWQPFDKDALDRNPCLCGPV